MFAILNSVELESSYRRNYHRRSSKPDLYCQFCQRRFSKSYNLMVHERSHFEITQQNQQNNYFQQQQQVNSNKEYLCDVCGKNFRNRDLLRQHRSQHSPGGSSSSSAGSSGYAGYSNY